MRTWVRPDARAAAVLARAARQISSEIRRIAGQHTFLYVAMQPGCAAQTKTGQFINIKLN